MELALLILLAVLLIACTVFSIAAVKGLAVWFVLLFIYELSKGRDAGSLIRACLKNIKQTAPVILNLLFVGMLSSQLRASGTITAVISLCLRFVTPVLVLPSIFVICSVMSLCTGSAFASAATAGVICASLGASSSLPAPLYCGAILSGIYLGDRMSPLSSSANLVAGITGNDIYTDFRMMLRGFPLPFLSAVVLYLGAGLLFSSGCDTVTAAAGETHWISLLPIGMIVVMSLLRINSKLVLFLTSAVCLMISVLCCHTGIVQALLQLFSGYHTDDPSLSMLNGGGAFSMISPALTLLVSTFIIGIFNYTGFLEPIGKTIREIRLPVTVKNLLLSIVSSAIAGSQTMAIMFTTVLCTENFASKEEKALFLENTCVLFTAVIPWDISYSVPAASIGSPAACIFFAFYIYLVPLFYFLGKKKRLPSSETI